MRPASFDGIAPKMAFAQNACVVSRQANGELTLGDVITGVNGKTIKAQKDLFGALDELKVGDKVQLEILRDGKKINVEVTLADRVTQGD